MRGDTWHSRATQYISSTHTATVTYMHHKKRHDDAYKNIYTKFPTPYNQYQSITRGSRSLRDPEVFVMEIQNAPAHSIFGLGRDTSASDSKLTSMLFCNFISTTKEKIDNKRSFWISVTKTSGSRRLREPQLHQTSPGTPQMNLPSPQELDINKAQRT